MRSIAIFTVLTASFSGFVAGFTKPVGDPKGNAIIKPSLGEPVPCGKPYDITWIPDTPGTVTLLLLRGPSTNVVPIGPPIVEKYANTGKFSWIPSCDLEPDTTHYGIQLIVDATGQYQYSVQFGISNANYKPSHSGSATTTASATGTATVTGTGTAKGYGGTVTTSTATTIHTTKYPTLTTTTTVPEKNTTVATTTKHTTTTTKEMTTKHVPTYAPTTLVTHTVDSTPTKTPPASNTTAVYPAKATGGASSRFVGAGMAVLSVVVAGFAML